MSARSLAFAAVVILAALWGCDGGSDSATYTATSGVAQKGPLTAGSTVTAQELSASLLPAGESYSYQTDSDFGTFRPDSTFTSRYIGTTATGYYFDEHQGHGSDGPITLTGISDLSTESVLNVNLLTTLANQRIRHLVANSGLKFADARKQAEAEVLSAFGIHNASGYGTFGELDLGRGREGDMMLAALSSVFSLGGGVHGLTGWAAGVGLLMADFQSEIANGGAITSPRIVSALAWGSQYVSAAAVAEVLTQKYAAVGTAFTAADIGAWIDRDGDGLIAKFKYQVPNATQTTSYAIPTSVTDPYAGRAVAVSTGQLLVNGIAITGPATIRSGDVVSLTPPGSVFPNGVVTAYLSSGTRRIARVTFISGVASIAVTPSSATLPKGTTQQFKATGTFTDGNVADLTASASWTSSAPAVAALDPGSGLATAVGLGTATVTASSGGVSASATVTVSAAALLSIAITPDPFATGVGITRQMSATGTYSDGSRANLNAIATWSSSQPSIASVAGGLLTGVGPGVTAVAAKSGATAGTATLNVTSGVWNPMGKSSGYGYAPPPATLLANGKVLFTGSGGVDGQLFDFVTETWSAAGTIPWSRLASSYRATLIADGRVLITGGVGMPPDDSSGRALATAYLYDPVTNSWSAAASMANARARHTATLLPSGKILVVGGTADLQTDASILATAEIYDPVGNTWSPAASMALSRSSHTATLLRGGRVLVLGATQQAAKTAEVYDPVADTWSPAADPLLLVGPEHVATLLNDGRVLVTGANANDLYSRDAEIYDPLDNKWSRAASMLQHGVGHTATLLPSGRVLVAGGGDYGGTAGSWFTSLYDPATDTWTEAANMARGRRWHSATLLPSGAVLVGGGTRGSWLDDFAEAYW